MVAVAGMAVGVGAVELLLLVDLQNMPVNVAIICKHHVKLVHLKD